LPRNVLQAMVAQLALLRSRHFEASAVSSSLDELEGQVRRGAALTRQPLLFSRRETTRREHLDINDIVREAADMLRRLMRENITLIVEPATDALPAEADRAQLEQVSMNLAVNASGSPPAWCASWRSRSTRRRSRARSARRATTRPCRPVARALAPGKL
jgi:two-component system cell cycle sensor histidine kinase/response regulator CckA